MKNSSISNNELAVKVSQYLTKPASAVKGPRRSRFGSVALLRELTAVRGTEYAFSPPSRTCTDLSELGSFPSSLRCLADFHQDSAGKEEGDRQARHGSESHVTLTRPPAQAELVCCLGSCTSDVRSCWGSYLNKLPLIGRKFSKKAWINMWSRDRMGYICGRHI